MSRKPTKVWEQSEFVNSITPKELECLSLACLRDIDEA